MILAGNLTVLEALELLVVFTAALFPVFWLLLRRLERVAFERHLRARGARPATEAPRRRGHVIDADPDLEENYGTVNIVEPTEYLDVYISGDPFPVDRIITRRPDPTDT